MNKKSLLALFVSVLSTSLVLHPKAANAAGFGCPVVGASSDCATVIQISDSSTGPIASISNTAGIRPYDGGDDDLVGIINNSTKSLAAITLSGTGNGGGIFAFDGDGLCQYITCNYSHPTGYEGPLTTFSNINSIKDTGTVNFTGGLNPGVSTYFSLEGSPSSIQGTGGGTISVGGIQTNPVPEPLTVASTAAAGVMFLWLKRKKLKTFPSA